MATRTPQASLRKRKVDVIDLTGDVDNSPKPQAKKLSTQKSKSATRASPKLSKKPKVDSPEKRLRPYRGGPSNNFFKKYERATSQRSESGISSLHMYD